MLILYSIAPCTPPVRLPHKACQRKAHRLHSNKRPSEKIETLLFRSTPKPFVILPRHSPEKIICSLLENPLTAWQMCLIITQRLFLLAVFRALPPFRPAVGKRSVASLALSLAWFAVVLAMLFVGPLLCSTSSSLALICPLPERRSVQVGHFGSGNGSGCLQALSNPQVCPFVLNILTFALVLIKQKAVRSCITLGGEQERTAILPPGQEGLPIVPSLLPRAFPIAEHSVGILISLLLSLFHFQFPRCLPVVPNSLEPADAS